MKTTTRREILRVGLGGVAAVSLGATVPSFVARVAFAQNAPATRVSGDNVLVVLQLTGGNDGLNTVIPVGRDEYLKARPQLAIREKFHKLSDELALHPAMGKFKAMFDDGRLAVVNGCGYPQPDRSHFRSMDIWHTAEPKEHGLTGWLGHYIDHALRGSDNPLSAVNVGSELPLALVREAAPVPSIQSLGDFKVRTDPGSPFDAKLEAGLIAELNALRAASPALEFLSRQATNAIVSADALQKLAGYSPDVPYPGHGLARQLQLVAQLIAGGTGTRVFYLQIGGFDTHANQNGSHHSLLQQVADSVKAFDDDLRAKGLGGKVTVMCFSEFGRRVGQNDSNGTDHGAAGPMFVCGAVKGGLYGEQPSLADLEDGDLKHTVDFRRVYATLLDQWMAADSKQVLGQAFEPLGFI